MGMAAMPNLANEVSESWERRSCCGRNNRSYSRSHSSCNSFVVDDDTAAAADALSLSKPCFRSNHHQYRRGRHHHHHQHQYHGIRRQRCNRFSCNFQHSHATTPATLVMMAICLLLPLGTSMVIDNKTNTTITLSSTTQQSDTQEVNNEITATLTEQTVAAAESPSLIKSSLTESLEDTIRNAVKNEIEMEQTVGSPALLNAMNVMPETEKLNEKIVLVEYPKATTNVFESVESTKNNPIIEEDHVEERISECDSNTTSCTQAENNNSTQDMPSSTNAASSIAGPAIQATTVVPNIDEIPTTIEVLIDGEATLIPAIEGEDVKHGHQNHEDHQHKEDTPNHEAHQNKEATPNHEDHRSQEDPQNQEDHQHREDPQNQEGHENQEDHQNQENQQYHEDHHSQNNPQNEEDDQHHKHHANHEDHQYEEDTQNHEDHQNRADHQNHEDPHSHKDSQNQEDHQHQKEPQNQEGYENQEDQQNHKDHQNHEDQQIAQNSLRDLENLQNIKTDTAEQTIATVMPIIRSEFSSDYETITPVNEINQNAQHQIQATTPANTINFEVKSKLTTENDSLSIVFEEPLSATEPAIVLLEKAKPVINKLNDFQQATLDTVEILEPVTIAPEEEVIHNVFKKQGVNPVEAPIYDTELLHEFPVTDTTTIPAIPLDLSPEASIIQESIQYPTEIPKQVVSQVAETTVASEIINESSSTTILPPTSSLPIEQTAAVITDIPSVTFTGKNDDPSIQTGKGSRSINALLQTESSEHHNKVSTVLDAYPAGQTFNENLADEATNGIGHALPTRRDNDEVASSSSRSAFIILICSSTALLFIIISVAIFLVSFQRQHGTLDIEMQEQRCGKDIMNEDEAETCTKLLEVELPRTSLALQADSDAAAEMEECL